MEENAKMPELRQCWDCDYDVVTAESACPQCGSTQFFTATHIKVRGVMLTALGAIFTLAIAAVEFIMVRLLSGPVKGTYGGMSAEAKKAAIILSIAGLGIVLILGVVFTAGGLGMAINGKRNTRFVSTVITLLTAASVVFSIMMLVFGT
ncbi:MAG: hypothetical protein IPM21_08035 [Acidobacteria bacterium]|nr:hypothetical protein [Acidobacteriota bacterium]